MYRMGIMWLQPRPVAPWPHFASRSALFPQDQRIPHPTASEPRTCCIRSSASCLVPLRALERTAMDTTAPTKLLVICTANRLRSVTLAAMLQQTPGFEVRSAGTHPHLHGRPITRKDINWADQLVIFEPFHLKELVPTFSQARATETDPEFRHPR